MTEQEQIRAARRERVTKAMQEYYCKHGRHADEEPGEHDYGPPHGVRMVWRCPHCGNVRGRS